VKLQETPRFVQHVSTGWVIGTSRQRVIMSVINRRGNAPVLVQLVVEKKQVDMIPVVTGINGMPCNRT
jgi:hypothetical protein